MSLTCYNPSGESSASVEDLLKDTTLVFATAPWCGPCKQVKPPLFAALQEQGSEWFVLDVSPEDTAPRDDIESLVGQLKIAALPTLLVLQNGKEAGRVEGANLQSMLQLVKQLAVR